MQAVAHAPAPALGDLRRLAHLRGGHGARVRMSSAGIRSRHLSVTAAAAIAIAVAIAARGEPKAEEDDVRVELGMALLEYTQALGDLRSSQGGVAVRRERVAAPRRRPASHRFGGGGGGDDGHARATTITAAGFRGQIPMTIVVGRRRRRPRGFAPQLVARRHECQRGRQRTGTHIVSRWKHATTGRALWRSCGKVLDFDFDPPSLLQNRSAALLFFEP
jgi:hypothetical protein